MILRAQDIRDWELQEYEQFIIQENISNCQRFDLVFLSITQQHVYFAKLALL